MICYSASFLCVAVLQLRPEIDMQQSHAAMADEIGFKDARQKLMGFFGIMGPGKVRQTPVPVQSQQCPRHSAPVIETWLTA